MYIIINNITNESAIIKEKTPLAKHLGVSFNTVNKNKDLNVWKIKSFTVYKPEIIEIKSKRGH